MTQPLSLLLLSGGGHTGTNVMVALAGRHRDLRVVATSDTATEPALFAFDAVYLAPRIATDPAGFEARIIEVIERERPALVVPCRDEDVQWLAGLGARRPDLRGSFLCGDPGIAEVINDKWRSFTFCQDHGLPFAASCLCVDSTEARAVVDDFVTTHGLPVVAKPRHGVDSKDVLLLTSLAQTHRAMHRDDFVLQQFLGDPDVVEQFLQQVAQEGVPLFHTFQGIKRSLQIMIGPDGAILHVVCTLNRMTGRNARSIAIDDDPDAVRIGTRCAEVFAAVGWRGPLNVQCQPDRRGRLLIHEFNGHFTGATGARWRIGVDEVGAAIRAFTGRSIGPGAPAGADSPAEAFEGLVARAADPACVATLAANGAWVAAPR
jgi:hypothetical protein